MGGLHLGATKSFCFSLILRSILRSYSFHSWRRFGSSKVKELYQGHTELVTGRTEQNPDYFGLYSTYSVISQKLPNFCPFHHYRVLAPTAAEPREKKKKKNLCKISFYRLSLHRLRRGNKSLLTEGGLGLSCCPRAGEGRGTRYAVSVWQSFQRLPSSTITKSRKPSSSRRCNQTFKTFKGPSTIRLKNKERAHIR